MPRSEEEHAFFLLVCEHGSQLRIGPTGRIVGFDQPALLDVARARGFDGPVSAELLPAAERGMLEGLGLTGREEAREDPGPHGEP